MQFKLTEAAFEGFRLIRREPRTIAIWAVFGIVAGVALTVAMIGSGFGRFTAVSAQGTMTPDAIMGFVAGEVIAIGGAILIASIMGAAVYRAVLRPAEAPLTRLRLGGDELRLVALSVIMGILFTLLLVAMIIPVALMAAAVGIGAGVTQGAGGMSVLLLIALLGYLLVIVALIFFAVRFSLAGVQTFAEGRLRVFESWRLTKGRFWRLLGCYSLAAVSIVPLYLVMIIVYLAASFAFAGGDFARAMAEISRPDMTSLAAYFNPARVIYLVLGGALGGVVNAVMYAPAAAVYRDIADRHPANQAEVFS